MEIENLEENQQRNGDNGKEPNRNYGNERMILLVKKFNNTERPSENFIYRQD